MLADSGNRTDFGSGALRDMAEGKGRTDLLPWSTVAVIFEHSYSDEVIQFAKLLDEVSRDNSKLASLHQMIHVFCKMQDWDLPTFCLESAKQYEAGVEKYGPRNWEKGMPVHIFIDSCGRHFLKLLRGDNDEPHDRAVAWNLLGALWTISNKPEWIDKE